MLVVTLPWRSQPAARTLASARSTTCFVAFWNWSNAAVDAANVDFNAVDGDAPSRPAPTRARLFDPGGGDALRVRDHDFFGERRESGLRLRRQFIQRTRVAGRALHADFGELRAQRQQFLRTSLADAAACAPSTACAIVSLAALMFSCTSFSAFSIDSDASLMALETPALAQFRGIVRVCVVHGCPFSMVGG